MPRRRPLMAREQPEPNRRAADSDLRLPRRAERAVGPDLHLCAFDAGDRITGAERMRTVALAIFIAWGSPGPADAHGGEVHGAAMWTFDPWIVAPLLIVGLPYLL